ncbi:hypothetical protein LEP1GSC058_1783 [Leptospira fainei serovar Hurstbridge str. BUT 6]|uniref:Uncharacterized protein n=1 Tax=Leptospira fainei serovar Hurstbridge str. BUT 6 TaxID=1193011 RepID=S3UZT2_9LEPT|nr:hypothetical protein [Leptospira fainei]EPG74733.1 hypothetical protein LEP1GSC058_1783 [Leptospira fainei serovar Hurstbridge str. BUT 6]
MIQNRNPFLQFHRWRILKFLNIFLLLSFSDCISLRVYVPRTYPGVLDSVEQWRKYKDLGTHGESSLTAAPSIIVEFPEESKTQFAKRNPTWLFFAPNYLKNEYGPLTSLMRKEFSEHPDEYRGNYRIVIKRFDLSTKDNWIVHPFTNLVSVNFEADVFSAGKNDLIWQFRFQDSIESATTDAMFVISTISLVGWIIYMPYLGYRGNREDQLNQLGRIALLEFFEGWKRHPVLGSSINPAGRRE